MFSQVAQNIADRLFKCIRGMVLRKKAGIKAGFPRFKSTERVKSFTYPQFGFKLDEKLELSGIGKVSIKKHREVKGYSLGETGKTKRIWLAREVLADEVKKNGGRICGRRKGWYFESSVGVDHKKLKEAEEVYGFTYRKIQRIKDYGRFMLIDERMVVFYSGNVGFVYHGGLGELIMNLVMLKIDAPKRLNMRIDSILKSIIKAIDEAHKKAPMIPASE